MATTYYELLGVDSDASQDEIRDAYREKVKEFHPDVSDRPDAEERFKEVKRAEIVLGDPEERATYDRLGHEVYVDGDDPEPNQPTEDEVRWAAARAAAGEHDAGGRSTGWRERERRQRRSGRAEWFRENVTDDDPFDDLYADVGGPTASDDRTAQTAPGTADAGASSRSSANPAGRTTPDGAGGARSRSSGHAVHDWTDERESASIPRPDWTQDDVVLLASSLLLYPILLFLTAVPAFPLIARVAIGLTAIALVAFLLPRPAFGLPVFGIWSLLLPVFLFAFGVAPWSPMGLVTLGGVWLPLGYSVAVAMVLRR